MTARLHSFLVVLDHEMREDDAEAVLTALRMVKHVIDVTPNVSDYSAHVAKMTARMDIEKRLWKALREEEK